MNKPKVRFKGYTEDWEQRKLGDICQVTMGQSPDGSTYSDEPSDYILVQGNADLISVSLDQVSENLDYSENKNSSSWRFNNEC